MGGLAPVYIYPFQVKFPQVLWSPFYFNLIDALYLGILNPEIESERNPDFKLIKGPGF